MSSASTLGLNLSVMVVYCFCSATRRRTQWPVSSTWSRRCANRRSITISKGIKWKFSFLNSTTRSVRSPEIHARLFSNFCFLNLILIIMCSIKLSEHSFRCGSNDLVSTRLWINHREIQRRSTRVLQSGDEGQSDVWALIAERLL